MDVPATPEFMIGHMRVLTMVEQTYFYISNQPTMMSELDKDLDLMIPRLEAARPRPISPRPGRSLFATTR